MSKSLNERDRMSAFLLNKEEARVLRAELERAQESLGLARKWLIPVWPRPRHLPAQEAVAPPTPPYVKLLDVAKLLSPIADCDSMNGVLPALFTCSRGAALERHSKKSPPFFPAGASGDRRWTRQSSSKPSREERFLSLNWQSTVGTGI